VTDAPDWTASRRRRWQVIAIAAIASPLIRLLSLTWRWRVDGGSHVEPRDAVSRPLIHAFWHGRIVSAMVFFRRRGIVVITSENFDGEWIARIIRRFGYGTARGSSSRGGVKALVQLRRDMAAGRSTAFTLDGPRGPREVAQPGAVWLARATGHAILPFHLEADRHWTLRSWDRTQIPKPFATVGIAIGAPYTVPPDADVDAALSDLQARMARLVDGARALARRGDA
jgi:hypothetical protein